MNYLKALAPEEGFPETDRVVKSVEPYFVVRHHDHAVRQTETHLNRTIKQRKQIRVNLKYGQ